MNHKLSSSATAAGIISFLVLFLFMPLGADAEGSKSINESGTVATVNKTAITLRDISYRKKTEEAYGNNRATAEVALVSIINDVIEREVALRHGVVVTQEEQVG